ncbi:hypothetical protein SUDANB95_05490 [Actinosynnema sp. ALI-1.44]
MTTEPAPRPVFAEPDYRYEHDEDGNPHDPSAGWDLAFGCRVSFGTMDGVLRASVHMSDHELSAGCSVREVTPEQIRTFANHLLHLLAELKAGGPVAADTTGHTAVQTALWEAAEHEGCRFTPGTLERFATAAINAMTPTLAELERERDDLKRDLKKALEHRDRYADDVGRVFDTLRPIVPIRVASDTEQTGPVELAEQVRKELEQWRSGSRITQESSDWQDRAIKAEHALADARAELEQWSALRGELAELPATASPTTVAMVIRSRMDELAEWRGGHRTTDGTASELFDLAKARHAEIVRLAGERDRAEQSRQAWALEADRLQQQLDHVSARHGGYLRDISTTLATAVETSDEPMLLSSVGLAQLAAAQLNDLRAKLAAEQLVNLDPAPAGLTERVQLKVRTVEPIDHVLDLVRTELIDATQTHGPITSPHEGYAVIAEELDELWDAVKTDDPTAAAGEAIQVAAMGARYLLDLYPTPVTEEAPRG